MYSEKLEQLIKSVIADGVVTEKERAVLHKKAEAEGVDKDEIDVYVDGLLALQPTKKGYNMELFDKLTKGSRKYFQFKKFYKVPSELPDPFTDMWIGFVDVVTSGREEYLGRGILVCINLKDSFTDYSCYPSLLLKTDIGTFEADYSFDYIEFQFPSFNGKKCDYLFAYQMDAAQLKMLAESTTTQLSLERFEIKPKKKNGDVDYDAETIRVSINNINCPGLLTNLQDFYREVIKFVDTGVVTEKESDAEPTKKPTKKVYNLEFFDKLARSDYKYYQFKKFYKVTSKLPNPTTDMWIGFVDVVTSETKRCLGTGIIVCLNLNNREIWRIDPHLTIKTNIGTFEADYEDDYNNFQFPSFDGKECDRRYAYQMDEDQLRMLAESTTIQLSFTGRYGNDKFTPINNINCPGLLPILHNFYREAYPSAVNNEQTAAADTQQRKDLTCPHCGESVPQLAEKCPHCDKVVTSEASWELKEIFDNLEIALIDLKNAKDVEYNKATIDRYVRKAKMYYGNNPKVKKHLEEIEVEKQAAEIKAKKDKQKKLLIKVLINPFFWCGVSLVIGIIWGVITDWDEDDGAFWPFLAAFVFGLGGFLYYIGKNKNDMEYK